MIVAVAIRARIFDAVALLNKWVVRPVVVAWLVAVEAARSVWSGLAEAARNIRIQATNTAREIRDSVLAVVITAQDRATESVREVQDWVIGLTK